MYELQCHMGIMELPPIYFVITLGDVASAYALRSEPFLVLTLSKLRFVLRLVETDQMKQVLCGVVEGFARAANLKFHIGDESSFHSCRAADYGFHVLPFLNFMSSSWLTSEDLELQQAAVKVCDIAQLLESEIQVKVFYCLRLLVLEMSQKKCAVVKAMRCTLGDQSTEVKKAILHFLRTLLSVQGLDDWAWDLVAYIFKQSSLSSSQMKSKNRSSQDAEEEQSIRATCVEILENLDVSISGLMAPAAGVHIKFPKAQGLVVRLLVVASALGDGSCAHSALRGLWALHRTIHPAVGEQWRIKIPILLSTIEGNPETSQDNVWCQHLLLKTSPGQWKQQRRS
ncbi:maestro heat-like repeat-containing protein family member 2B [Alligator mississippiensis]|uniref:Maestro heat-like repeat-containing protein family member 2B n=1 Tax=Alligator mississippiensis TaxID=8496 RepID=A0A151M7L4_ALLMI|nr:maestro heat-like repeat-containing protein family member 2B [Alligator mississippiensis]